MRVLHLLSVALAAESLPHLVSAASLPAQRHGTLNKRAQEAGFGVELESRKLIFVNEDQKAQDAPDDKIVAIKGATVSVVGGEAKASTEHWKLTAEHSGLEKTRGLGYLVGEFIVDGEKVKLGQGNGKRIGNEITKFLEEWKPNQKDGTRLNIKGFESYGPWAVKQPDVWWGAKSLLFGKQITTSMPLAAVYKMMKDVKSGKGSKLYSSISNKKKANIHIVEERDFADAELHKIRSSDITDDMLGFFSLLVSYAKATKDMKASEGPKHSLSIMPRTDFVTMYKMFDAKLKAQYEGGCSSLFDIVQKLARKDGDGGRGVDRDFNDDQLDKATFKWLPPKLEPISGAAVQEQNPKPIPVPPPMPPPLPKKPAKRSGDEDDGDVSSSEGIRPSWPGSNTDIHSGTLSVRKWLDRIQDNDQDCLAGFESKLRYGQVGQLGNKLENTVGGVPAPIFEFRDIDSSAGDKLGDDLDALEESIKSLHEQYRGPGMIRRASDLFTRKVFGDGTPGKNRKQPGNGDKKSCERKCQKGEAMVTTNGRKQCVKDCPKGQGKSADGKTCQITCPKGEARIGKSDKCEKCQGSCPEDKKCGEGKKASKDGKACVDEIECADGEAKVTGVCTKCKKGEKPNAKGDGCVKANVKEGQKEGKPKGEDENKDNVDEEEKKKKEEEEKKKKEEEERKKKEEEEAKNKEEEERNKSKGTADKPKTSGSGKSSGGRSGGRGGGGKGGGIISAGMSLFGGGD